ncbi:hypothetical protein GCM10010302_16820 [Streptomyces polychromogenes]|uniref:Uncharacterized protein n=1 Tax=Streptomyces polychromogenes TaxID=67342 RepID=A0ABN0V837_9ACTN
MRERVRPDGELVGSPLDGMLLDATGWGPQEFVDHTVLMSENGSGRSSAPTTCRPKP